MDDGRNVNGGPVHHGSAVRSYRGGAQILQVQQPSEQYPNPSGQYALQSLPVGQVPSQISPGPVQSVWARGAAVACDAPNPSDPATKAPNTTLRTIRIWLCMFSSCV